MYSWNASKNRGSGVLSVIIFQEGLMTIKEMQRVLNAKFLYGEELADLDAQFVFFRRYDE